MLFMANDLSNPALDLPDLLGMWTRVLESENKSPATLKNYTAGVKAYIRWCTERGEEPRLDRTLVTEWIADLLATGIEPSSARTRQQALRRFSAWLADEDAVDYTDQLLGFKPPKIPEKLIQPLTDIQLKVLLAACDGKSIRDRRDEAIIRLLVDTGMRAGELLALEVGDINMTARVVTIRKAKGGRGRVVNYRPRAAVALDKYLMLRRRHPGAGLPNLWLSNRGNNFALSYTGLRFTIAERAELAGIKDFHIHLLRHTNTSRLLNAGMPEQALMTRNGWRDRSMLDRYSRATASDRAMEEFDRLNLPDL